MNSTHTRSRGQLTLRAILSVLCVLSWAVLPSSCKTEGKTQPPVQLSIDEAKTRVAALAKTLADKPADQLLMNEWCNARIYLGKANFLLKSYKPSEQMLKYLSKEVANAEQAAGVIKKKKTPPLIKGMREEGYYCDNDDSYQPFLRYVPQAAKKGKKLPLIVYLHGYASTFNIINWQIVPQSLIDFAERNNFLFAAPFGRSNTDFQGIGEQDVLNVIAEMKKRYAVDEDRVILAGISMGGMGTWTIGAHYPDLFAGLLIVSGRGDYYFWQKVSRESLPAYKQRLIDTDFAMSLLPNLQHIPIYVIHGSMDTLIPVEEARNIVNAVKKVNPDLTYVELENGDHWIYEEAFAREDMHEWIRKCKRSAPAMFEYKTYHPKYRRGASDGLSAIPRGPVKEAFLSPFVFVFAGDPADKEKMALFAQAMTDWYMFAKAYPRIAYEKTSATSDLSSFNVFLFGEPENSEMIRTVLKDSPVKVTEDSFVVGDKSFPRKGNGLYLVQKSPWNTAKLAVIQCGIPWGQHLSDNHKYDFLPDYIVYTSEQDKDSSNTALCAGFFDENWKIER